MNLDVSYRCITMRRWQCSTTYAMFLVSKTGRVRVGFSRVRWALQRSFKGSCFMVILCGLLWTCCRIRSSYLSVLPSPELLIFFSSNFDQIGLFIFSHIWPFNWTVEINTERRCSFGWRLYPKNVQESMVIISKTRLSPRMWSNLYHSCGCGVHQSAAGMNI